MSTLAYEPLQIMRCFNRGKFLFPILFFLIFISLPDAGPLLSGTVNAMTISPDGNPIAVCDAITIPKSGNDTVSFSKKNEKPKGVRQKARTNRTNLVLPTAKVTTVAGVAALCFMTYYLHQKSEYVSLYNNAKSQIERKDYYEKQKPFSRNAIMSGFIGGIMLSAGGALFGLDHYQKKKRIISFYPVIGPENGILVSFDF
jgi:hypothetical protein